MTELEKVEKLREKADVTFAEAKEALDNSGGDILEALIWLENQGKAIVPAGGGFFSGSAAPDGQRQQQYQQQRQNQYQRKNNYDHGGKAANGGGSFSVMMKKLGRFCLDMLHKGNTNFLDATSRGGEHMFSCPVTVLVLLVVCFFWVTVPLFVLSLFLGFRYNFRGQELGTESINRVMDGASNVVEDVKRNFSEGRNGTEENGEQ